MGQRTMDKPPTKAKPSAFDAEAKALDKRLDQLASDYTSLFLRYPHVEGQRRTPCPGSHGIQRGPAPSPSADSGGLEPPTPGSVGRCSIQLSYESPGRAR